MMSENEAVLVGMKEVAAFLRVSEFTVRGWMEKYADMPVYQERPGARLCADKEALATWQRRLYAGSR
jgi:transposase